MRSAIGGGQNLGCAVDGLADALVRAAAADVAAHDFIDIGIARLGLFRQQGRRRHDLPRLAIAALWNVQLRPRFLHSVAAIGRQAFDGRDSLSRHARYGSDAGANGLSVLVDRARAAQRHAAAEFRTGHSQRVAQHPQQRHLWGHVYGLGLSVQGKSDARHPGPPELERSAIRFPLIKFDRSSIHRLKSIEPLSMSPHYPSRSSIRSSWSSRRFWWAVAVRSRL